MQVVGTSKETCPTQALGMLTSIPCNGAMEDVLRELLKCGTQYPAFVEAAVAFAASRMCQRPILVLTLHYYHFGAQLFVGRFPCRSAAQTSSQLAV